LQEPKIRNQVESIRKIRGIGEILEPGTSAQLRIPKWVVGILTYDFKFQMKSC
jgi:hypothetical protein